MTGAAVVVQADALHLPLPDSSVDAIVCDPPYGLEFMGKDWDAPWRRVAGIDERQGQAWSSARTGSPKNGNSPHDRKPRWSARNSSDAAQAQVRSEAAAYQAWCQQWATEALRVLKPGGWLLAFGGTRTWHRLTSGIEDAGFELRDQIADFGPLAWVYGQGFPKSRDVGKDIDKMAPRRGMFADFANHYATQRKAAGLTHAQVCEAGHFYDQVNHGGASVNWEAGHNVPTMAQWPILRALLSLSDAWLPLIERVEAEREVLGRRHGLVGSGFGNVGHGLQSAPDAVADTAPATPEAERWHGWGTALKPAWEPIVVARKPLAGTVAGNVLTYGTGALNIDACRVPGVVQAGAGSTATFRGGDDKYELGTGRRYQSSGRWPSNVVLTHADGCQPTGTRKVRGITGGPQAAQSGYEGGPRHTGTRGHLDPDGTETIEAWDCQPDCPVGLLDQQSGERPTALRGKFYDTPEANNVYGPMGHSRANPGNTYGDQGGASRFFYTAKADANERVTIDGDGHPTVKPLDLVRWLVRLITPPEGLVLDMFAGSGTTGEAAMLEGFQAVVVDRDPASCAKAKVRAHPYVRRRIIVTGPPTGPIQESLL